MLLSGFSRPMPASVTSDRDRSRVRSWVIDASGSMSASVTQSNPKCTPTMRPASVSNVPPRSVTHVDDSLAALRAPAISTTT